MKITTFCNIPLAEQIGSCQICQIVCVGKVFQSRLYCLIKCRMCRILKLFRHIKANVKALQHPQTYRYRTHSSLFILKYLTFQYQMHGVGFKFHHFELSARLSLCYLFCGLIQLVSTASNNQAIHLTVILISRCTCHILSTTRKYCKFNDVFASFHRACELNAVVSSHFRYHTTGRFVHFVITITIDAKPTILIIGSK